MLRFFTVAEDPQCPNCIRLSQVEKRLKEVLQDHERIKKELEELKQQYMMGNATNGMVPVDGLFRVKDEPASPVPRLSPPISPQSAEPQVSLPEALIPEEPLPNDLLMEPEAIPEGPLPNDSLMEPEAGPSRPRSSTPKRRRSKRKSAKVTNPLPEDDTDSFYTATTRSSRRSSVTRSSIIRSTRSSSTGGRNSSNSTRSLRSRLSLPPSTTSGRIEVNENQLGDLGGDQLDGRQEVVAVPETLARESAVDEPIPFVPVVVKPEPVSPVANRRGNKRRSSRTYNGINDGHESGGNPSGQQNGVQQDGGHSSGQQNGVQQDGGHSSGQQNGVEETSRKRIMFSWASKRIKKEEPEEESEEEEDRKPIIPLPIPIKPEPDDYVPSLPSPTHSWELMSDYDDDNDDTFPHDDNDNTFPDDDNDDTFPGDDQRLVSRGVDPLADPLDLNLDATDSQETIVDTSEPSAHLSSSLDRIIAQVAKEGPSREDEDVRRKRPKRRTDLVEDENLEHTNFRRLSKRPFDLHAQKVEIGTVSIPFNRVSISKSSIIITGVLTKKFKKTTSYGDLPSKIRNTRIQINLQRTCRPIYSFIGDAGEMSATQSSTAPSTSNHSGVIFKTDLMEDVSRKLASRHIASDPPITVLEASQIKITCSSLLDLDTFIDVLHEQGKKLTKVSDAQSQRTSHPYGDTEQDIKPDVRRIKLEAGMMRDSD